MPAVKEESTILILAAVGTRNVTVRVFVYPRAKNAVLPLCGSVAGNGEDFELSPLKKIFEVMDPPRTVVLTAVPIYFGKLLFDNRCELVAGANDRTRFSHR